MTSKSKEDYLKNIYHLQTKQKVVNTTALAGILSVSPASVSEMISRLSKEGLIKNTPYYGFKLTKSGEKIAVNLVRKHRLIEVFLHEHLNYQWDVVHQEAEGLEHVCSDIFIDKLEKYLKYPKVDPHGDPIPDKNGVLAETPDILLSEAGKSKSYMVSKVKDTSGEVLKYISKIGIHLKSKISIIDKLNIDKSILIKLNKKEYLLSNTIAEKISVIEDV
jgi:DtxR family Mn-dependent transcriptional regulator